MPSKLASFLCILLIIYLYWVDRRNNKGFSKALWVPFIWFIYPNVDRILSWLNIDISQLYSNAYSIEAGNPVNRTVYAILLIAGIIILTRRQIGWREIFTANKWIWLFFIFGALSCFWSDFPYITLKRLVKAFGTPVMAMVILTETKPYAAVGTILKRASFLLMPLSMLFIKYYPELGRTYHMGEPMYSGVADQKNGLGALCLMAGIYYLWNLFGARKNKSDQNQQLHITIYLIILPMIAWLLYMARSATSLVCLFIAAAIFIIAKMPIFTKAPQKLLQYGICGIATVFVFSIVFDIKGLLLELVGRSSNLTNRTLIWNYLLDFVHNPIIGTGYESFWLGTRLDLIQDRWGDIIQAHNGYLEMYLNMGLIGIAFILCWVVTGLISISKHLKQDYTSALLRLCFVIVVLFYNYTEATFYGTIEMWCLFFIGIIHLPGMQSELNTPDMNECSEHTQ